MRLHVVSIEGIKERSGMSANFILARDRLNRYPHLPSSTSRKSRCTHITRRPSCDPIPINIHTPKRAGRESSYQTIRHAKRTHFEKRTIRSRNLPDSTDDRHNRRSGRSLRNHPIPCRLPQGTSDTARPVTAQESNRAGLRHCALAEWYGSL